MSLSRSIAEVLFPNEIDNAYKRGKRSSSRSKAKKRSSRRRKTSSYSRRKKKR